MAAPVEHSVPVASRGRNRGSSSDLSDTPSMTMMECFGRTQPTSAKGTVTKEMLLAMQARLQDEMDVKVTTLATSLASTLEARWSVMNRHTQEQVANLRSELAPLLQWQTEIEGFDRAERMESQLEDLRSELGEIRELLRARQAPTPSPMTFESAPWSEGSHFASVSVRPANAGVMFEEGNLPSIPKNGESMSMPHEEDLPRNQAMRQDESSGRTRPEVFTYDVVSSNLVVSEVRHPQGDDSHSNSLGVLETCALAELNRQMKVNTDRIDVLEHDHESAKFSIACDCLRLARGTIKHKSELQTIGWTRTGAGQNPSLGSWSSKQTYRASGRLEDADQSFLPKGDEYHFHENVWDASVLLFFPQFGWLANAILLIALVANISVQCLFCWIVSSLPTNTNDFSTEDVEALGVWRETASVEVVDLVCSPERRVPSTDYHAWITLHDADTYLEVTAQVAMTGPVLCVIVLIAWTLSITKITRLAVDFIGAVHEAGDKQSKGMSVQLHLSRFTISSVPYTRVAWAYVLGLLQIAIALVLLVVGSQWLVTTTRSGDLVLNAVALTYIMEIDEVIFFTVVPRQIALVIRNLEPLPCRVSVWKSSERVPFDIPGTSILSLVLMTLFVLGMSSVYLGDHVSQVQRAMETICGDRGNLL